MIISFIVDDSQSEPIYMTPSRVQSDLAEAPRVPCRRPFLDPAVETRPIADQLEYPKKAINHPNDTKNSCSQ